MANDKQKAAAPKLDVTKIMQSMGFSDADFIKVGGLRTIISAEVMHSHDVTVIGHLVALLEMPPRESLNKKGEKEDWQAVLIKLAAPAMGQQGKDGDIVPIAAGELALLPVTGALKNNPDLLNACIDPEKTYAAMIKVVGQLDTSGGKLNPMWDFDVRIVLKKPIPREGDPDLFLYGRSFGTNVNALVRGQTPGNKLKAPEGTYDPKTGEVHGGANAAGAAGTA